MYLLTCLTLVLNWCECVFFSSKLHIPANIGTAAAPGEVPTGEFVSANNAFQHGSCLAILSFLGSG